VKPLRHGRSIMAVAIASFVVAALLCMSYHLAALATMFVLGILVAFYRLGQIEDAALSEQQRRRRRKRMEVHFAEGPVGVWMQILGPTGVKIACVIGALVVAYCAAIELGMH
jgi:uncharacterized iron-regulated membrane protein